ncbi:MAG: mechanosensitive ion channel family protein, partial [Rhodopirellula sp. JB055]
MFQAPHRNLFRTHLVIAFGIFAFFTLRVSGLPVFAQESDKPKPAPLTTGDPDVPMDSLRVMVKPLTKDELAVEADAWFELLKAKARQIAVAKLGVRKTSDALAAGSEAEASRSLAEAEQVKKLGDKVAEKAVQTVTKAARESTGVDGIDASQKPVSPEGEESEDSTEAASGTEPPTAASVSTGKGSTNTAAKLKTNLLEGITVLQDERTSLSDRLKIVLDSWEAKGGEVENYRKYIVAVSGVEFDTTDAEAAWSTVAGWFVSKEGGQRWAWNIVKFILILVAAYLISKVLSGAVNWLLDRKIRLSQLAERLISNTIRNVFLAVGFAVAL